MADGWQIAAAAFTRRRPKPCQPDSIDRRSEAMLRALLLNTLATAALASGAPPSNSPVATLDLSRYTGEWHEIAHLPMFFQRQCVDTITATYKANPDGTIGVHNACRTKVGAMDASNGVAKPVGGQPGALKVRFAPEWLAWLPWVWANYWVVEVDPDYQWAVVGGPSRKYGCCRASVRWNSGCSRRSSSARANAATQWKSW
jgi:apolipoprotein D and lipocalin family protein